MEIEQTSIEKNFTVNHNGKIYTVSYFTTDGLIQDRDFWEIKDEELLEIESKKLKTKLINHCIKHFNNYKE